MTKSDDARTPTAGQSGPENGRLSESAESRTFDPNDQPAADVPNDSGSDGGEAGTHGRPADDTDPGHS